MFPRVHFILLSDLTLTDDAVKKNKSELLTKYNMHPEANVFVFKTKLIASSDTF